MSSESARADVADLMVELFGARAAQVAASRAARLEARGMEKPAGIWRALAEAIDQRASAGTARA